MIASEVDRRSRQDERGSRSQVHAGKAETQHRVDEIQRTFRQTCEAVETEIINTTRRIDSFTMSARDDLDTLVEVLDFLADTLGSEAKRKATVKPLNPADLDARLNAARALARTITETLGSASSALALLPRRTVALLHETDSVDRRRHSRVAVARRGRLVMGGTAVPCLTMDLSEGGSLVRLLGEKPDDREGAGLVVLDIEGLGRLQAVLIAGTEARINLAFCSTPPHLARTLAERLAEARRHERRLVTLGRRAADDIAGEMERLGPEDAQTEGAESATAQGRSSRLPSTIRTILGVAGSQNEDTFMAEAFDAEGRVLARWRADASIADAAPDTLPHDELPPMHGEHGRHRYRIREQLHPATGELAFVAHLDVEVRARGKHWGFVRLTQKV